MQDTDQKLRPNTKDYQQALQSMGTLLDVTAEDLMELAKRAEQFAQQRKYSAQSVHNLMTKPVESIYPHMSLKDAAQIMLEKRISGLPVVDTANRLIGIITEADLLRILGLPSVLPHHSIWHTLENIFSHLSHAGLSEAPDDPVEKHMTRHVITTAPDEHIQAVIDLMKRHQVKRVVVVDKQQHVLGIVTRSNLIKLFFHHFLNPEKSQS